MTSLRMNIHTLNTADRRGVVGTATWEFVSGDPVPDSGGLGGVTPVPVNHETKNKIIFDADGFAAVLPSDKRDDGEAGASAEQSRPSGCR